MRTIFTVLFLFFYIQFGLAQSLNYQELFGEDWNKGIKFEKENRCWMEPLFAKYNISYPIAISVIFPELVRYSALSDKMEITMLKTLYVNLGEDYADFSIGVFQMKPSFAEMIREKSEEIAGDLRGIKFKKSTGFDDIKDYRKSIIKDLEDPKIEINYLIAFFRICEKRFKPERMEELTRVKFLATAYNFGPGNTAGEIENMTDKKFYNTKLFKSECYCYADVSAFWYNRHISGE